MKTNRFEGLLKWYPSPWRTRYGEEMLALMEDTFADGVVPRSSRLALRRSAVVEHLRENGLGGGDETSLERVRSGSLRVLCGWTLLAIAGTAFAKMSEHWASATPALGRRVPIHAFDAIQIAASVAVMLIGFAALIALPAFVRFLRGGGWSEIRRPVSRAVFFSMTTGLFTFGVLAWALHRGSTYGGWETILVSVVWALMVITSLASCTLAATFVTRRLHLSETLLRVEGLLALLVTTSILTIVGGATTWTISIANVAPRLLVGADSGLFGVPGVPSEIVTGLVMFTGLCLSLVGARRVAAAIGVDRRDRHAGDFSAAAST